jgi:hypothetical protein
VPLRLFISSTLAALVAALAATSAAPAPAAKTLHRGQVLKIALTTRSYAVCVAIVRYADGALQTGAPKHARDGHLAWSLIVPTNAALGVGHWTVRCGIGIEKNGSFVVVAGGTATGGPAGNAPAIAIDKQGYSQRSDSFGTGSSVSFGLLLHNTSPTQDAMAVYVLVNMVAADGQLAGSFTRTVSLIAAGDTFAFGGSLQLRTQVAVAKLEVTIRAGAHQLKQTHATPEFANLRILPNTNDPGWVNEVDGELLNDTSTQTLASARLSIVLLDAAGIPVGGGTGSTSSPLPAGSRIVFIAQSGFTAVPLVRALTPVVSAEPSWSTG